MARNLSLKQGKSAARRRAREMEASAMRMTDYHEQVLGASLRCAFSWAGLAVGGVPQGPARP